MLLIITVLVPEGVTREMIMARARGLDYVPCYSAYCLLTICGNPLMPNDQ